MTCVGLTGWEQWAGHPQGPSSSHLFYNHLCSTLKDRCAKKNNIKNKRFFSSLLHGDNQYYPLLEELLREWYFLNSSFPSEQVGWGHQSMGTGMGGWCLHHKYLNTGYRADPSCPAPALLKPRMGCLGIPQYLKGMSNSFKRRGFKESVLWLRAEVWRSMRSMESLSLWTLSHWNNFFHGFHLNIFCVCFPQQKLLIISFWKDRQYGSLGWILGIFDYHVPGVLFFFSA